MIELKYSIYLFNEASATFNSLFKFWGKMCYCISCICKYKRCFDPFDNSTIRGYSVLKRLMDVAATLKVLFVLYGNDDTFNKWSWS